MEETEVLIVGAGPSGMALAIALAYRQVKSIVLESNREICQDPRAIAIAGDTYRMLRVMGIDAQQFQKIGQPVNNLHFHHDVFTTEPYFTLDHMQDWLNQGLSMGLCILQPSLEETMRKMIQDSEYTQLRTECKVVSRREVEDGVEIAYNSNDGGKYWLRGSYLVGADGKRGVVRKEFLEPLGIRQEVGIHDYSASWVAANLRITLPAPLSHPSFPLWELGYKPEELWDLFWPGGFHFCNHPTMPVAAGRFGSVDSRFWRHEYELPQGYVLEDLAKDLEVQITPHLKIPAQRLRNSSKLHVDFVQFPWDCVEIIRCQPAHFTHKVVNRWFDNRTVLIGDAAHVFPPFGAQGIANGIRDAFGLSWRLALLIGSEKSSKPFANRNELLQVWSQERRRGVDQASETTMQNGDLMRNKSWMLSTILSFSRTLFYYFPWAESTVLRWLLSDAEGFKRAKQGFFLPDFQGGGKMAQIWVQDGRGSMFLTDQLFYRNNSVVTLLVVGKLPDSTECHNLTEMLQSTPVAGIVSQDIVAITTDDAPSSSTSPPPSESVTHYFTCNLSQLSAAAVDVPLGYQPLALHGRLETGTRYVLVRSDFIVFSQASSLKQLSAQLARAGTMVGNLNGGP